MRFLPWRKKKRENRTLIKKNEGRALSSKPKPEAITHWQKEQFLREFNDREEVFFLELAQRSISKGYPVCRDLYFFCYFSTLRFRFMTQIGHDARFSYVYAWGLKDLNDQISFYEKKLDKWKKEGHDE
ncbi:MAG: hypothetical protein C4B57_09525 [Deltaproteobacteria bacterium]|nr:hypothetical protein [Deltaproteobacteria bacterium]PXF53412.1 MAG: hypothetical protein C4B57_09525 [Deltaproteobacteria bacterium]RKX59120.1 MAG: hypothetical protein DRP28_03700 [Thermodesulfobacteriota bacterium]